MNESLKTAIEYASNMCERLFDGFVVTDAEILKLATATEIHRDGRLQGMFDLIVQVAGFED
jgi:hypothetical protein